MRTATRVGLVVLTMLLSTATLSAQDVWTPLDAGVSQALFGVHFVTADAGYVVGAAGLVLKTTDGGATWADVSPGTGEDLYGVYFFDANAGVVVGGGGTILRTADGGATWTPIPSGTEDTLFSVDFADGVGLAGGTSQTILRSDDQGASWSVVQGGFFGGGIFGTDMLDASYGFVAGENSIFAPIFGASDDGGQSFDFTSFYLNGNEGRLLDVRFLSATEGVSVGRTFDFQGAVSRTTDGGASWTTTLFPDALNAVDFASAGLGYAAGFSGAMLKTTDGGLTWVAQTSGTAGALNDVSLPDPTTGYAVGDAGVVLKGAIPAGSPLTLAVTPLDPPVEVSPGGAFQFTVQVSNDSDAAVTFDLWVEAVNDDSGLTVTRGPRTFTLPAHVTRQATVTQRVPARAPAGTYTYTVKAGTFPDEASAADGFPVTVLDTEAAPSPSDAPDWALTFGPFEAASAAVGAQPAGFALEQNAPNPFGPETAIRYSLPERAHVTLRVYDVLGQEVAVLVDGDQEAGPHAVAFDASRLSAGAYFYRLEAASHTATRTMLLVK